MLWMLWIVLMVAVPIAAGVAVWVRRRRAPAVDTSDTGGHPASPPEE